MIVERAAVIARRREEKARALVRLGEAAESWVDPGAVLAGRVLLSEAAEEYARASRRLREAERWAQASLSDGVSPPGLDDGSGAESVGGGDGL